MSEPSPAGASVRDPGDGGSPVDALPRQPRHDAPAGARRGLLAGRPGGMDPRTAVMVVSAFAVVLLSSLAGLLPVPYAIYSPGPVVDTLGSVDGKPLISITGRKTFPASGQLDMTTVRVSGGPGNRANLLFTLYAWLDPSRSVLPEEAVFPPGRTAEESRREDQEMMTTSQESATAAALAALDIPVPTTLSIAGVQEDAPAADALEEGDVLLEAAGRPLPDLARLRATLAGAEPGRPIDLVVRRDGERREVTVRTIAGNGGRTLLGVYLDPQFRFPFSVDIQIENVVGPSAGLMFALGIVDRLTEGDLTGGQRVAGTGRIEADGTVGGIGGIRQKLLGARDAGAEVFLAPAENCDEVRGHVPDGLQVVRVSTLEDAMNALDRRGRARGAPLPAC